jgi:hypothetical protein
MGYWRRKGEWEKLEKWKTELEDRDTQTHSICLLHSQATLSANSVSAPVWWLLQLAYFPPKNKKHASIFNRRILIIFFVCVCVWEVLESELRACTLSHSTSPFLMKIFFQDRVLQNYLPGLASNCILLISASLVARITGVSHQRSA